jgi:hypothetical protein
MDRARPKSPSGQKMRGREPWHAVALVCKGQACEAVLALRGRRFLSAQAPRLPIPECSQPQNCQCSYRHYSDRRAGLRRAEEAAGFKRTSRNTEERRQNRDRRSPG